MLTKGFDGQITTAERAGSARAARKAGLGRAASAPSKANAVTTGWQRLATKYS